METFDPRPETMRNRVDERLPQLLEDVRGKGLCISLPFDPSVCTDTPATTTFLTKLQLLKKVIKFKKTLKVSEEDIRCIQIKTRGQSTSPQWFEAWFRWATTPKKSHVYFSQVQEQMGVGKRMWCVDKADPSEEVAR